MREIKWVILIEDYVLNLIILCWSLDEFDIYF